MLEEKDRGNQTRQMVKKVQTLCINHKLIQRRQSYSEAHIGPSPYLFAC